MEAHRIRDLPRVTQDLHLTSYAKLPHMQRDLGSSCCSTISGLLSPWMNSCISPGSFYTASFLFSFILLLLFLHSGHKKSVVQNWISRVLQEDSAIWPWRKTSLSPLGLSFFIQNRWELDRNLFLSRVIILSRLLTVSFTSFIIL